MAAPVFVETLPATGLSMDTPIVSIAGWLGAQDRHLAKYAETFNSLGAAVIHSTMPTADVFSPFDSGRHRHAVAALEAAESLRTRDGGYRRMYWVFFSNGGAWVWIAMQSQLAQGCAFEAHGRALAGVAFDSAPAYMHLLTGGRALTEGMKEPARSLAFALFVIFAGMWHIVATLTGTSSWTPWVRFWPLLKEARTPPKEVYVFCEDDHLCDAHKLRELIAIRKARPGADVSVTYFKSSKHVGHLRQHQHEYLQTMVALLASTAKNS